MTWRSLLFVPGARPRMLERAPTTGAHGLILDLEASVPDGEKERARARVAEAVPGITAATPAPVFVRVNTLASGLAADDVAAVARHGLAGVVLPAADGPDDVRQVAAWLQTAERAANLQAGTLRLLVILESARGVHRAFDILTATERVAGMLFGAEDFRRDMGVPRALDGREIAFARASVALAARAARVPAVDMVFTDLEDDVGLMEETRQARLLGYSGKQAIHPRQVALVHRAFGPTEIEVDWAARVVAEAERAAEEGIGAIRLDGMMVDRPVVEQARQILAAAEEEHDGGTDQDV